MRSFSVQNLMRCKFIRTQLCRVPLYWTFRPFLILHRTIFFRLFLKPVQMMNIYLLFCHLFWCSYDDHPFWCTLELIWSLFVSLFQHTTFPRLQSRRQKVQCWCSSSTHLRFTRVELYEIAERRERWSVCETVLSLCQSWHRPKHGMFESLREPDIWCSLYSSKLCTRRHTLPSELTHRRRRRRRRRPMLLNRNGKNASFSRRFTSKFDWILDGTKWNSPDRHERTVCNNERQLFSNKCEVPMPNKKSNCCSVLSDEMIITSNRFFSFSFVLSALIINGKSKRK